MMTAQKGDTFASLFKKYRLRSEIETLSQFGDLLAQEGLVYESSLFTHWQKGDRVPKDRKTLLAMIKIFFKKKGITSVEEANSFLESSGHRDLTEDEINDLMQDVDSIPFKAPLASVAELLRSYRIQRNLSQYEVALSVGLKNATQIVEIEQGLIESPPRALIDKICETLNLQESAKNAVLLAGNYLPTKKEIANIRRNTKSILDNWPYPALLYDFSWRIIMANDPFSRMVGMGEKEKRRLHKSTPAAIEIVFDPNFINNKYLQGEDRIIWYNNLQRFIVHFRALHKSITKQPWYIELIARMMKSELFRDIWKRAQEVDATLLVTRHGYKVFYDPVQRKKLKFNIFVVPLLHDPRFELEYFTPVDPETMLYFQNIQSDSIKTKT